MDVQVAFAFGMVGALAPEIVRLYSIRHSPADFRWSWFYPTASLLFALLGGAIAVAMPATTHWGALYAGASTPLILNTSLKKASAALTPEFKSLPHRPSRKSLIQSFLEGL